MRSNCLIVLLLTIAISACAPVASGSGVGGRLFIVQRETESLSVYDSVNRKILPVKVSGLGNMRHATMVFSRDLRWGYVATRNGLLSRIDLNTLEADVQIQTSDNSIGLAISQDGRFVAVAEYKPGGITIVAADTMEVVARIPALTVVDGQEVRSRVTGLGDTDGNRFVCGLMDGNEIWMIDASRPDFPVEKKWKTPAPNPFDAFQTSEGRFYVAGHFESDKLTLIDLWYPDAEPREITIRDMASEVERSRPIKMPHMAMWAASGDEAYIPVVGEKRLAVLDRKTWQYRKSIPLRGNPVYAAMSPAGREIWVTFSGSEDDRFIEIIDVETGAVRGQIEAGRKIFHLAFSPRGDEMYVSANQDNRFIVIDTRTRQITGEYEIPSPSGIFGPWRAFQIGF